MPDLVADTTAKDVVDDVISVLTDATVDDAKIFAEVGTFDDIASFQRVADPLKGIVAGIITKPPKRVNPVDNGDDYAERLAFEVAFRMSLNREAGEDEKTAADEMNRITSLIRAALLADKTRGGNCGIVVADGQTILGTDVTGEPRMFAPKPNQGFFTAVLPVVCAWSVPSSP